MKKALYAKVAMVLIGGAVFALKIPTGDNVRAADIKQEGDKILEVTLGGENPANVTTSLGAVKAAAGTNIEFYDNGAVKTLIATEQEVETPAGKVKVRDNTPITFYESGAVNTLNPDGQVLDILPLTGVKLADDKDMSFYENGKVKQVYLSGGGQTLETPIGELELGHKYDYSFPYIEYYESGSPKTIYGKGTSVLTINGNEYRCCMSTDGYGRPTPIEFYDSGSSDKWLVKSFVASSYEKDGKEIVSTAYESKIGTLEIALRFNRGENIIQLNEDGDVLSCQLYKSPDATVNVNGQDAFIKGGQYEHTYFRDVYGKDTTYDFANIAFYDDAKTIKNCVLDELVITEMDGTKLTLPAGEEVFFWENGGIKQCYSSNAAVVKVGKTQYDIEANKGFLFHKDGKLRAVEIGNNFIDTFYADGAPKRAIRYKGPYADNSMGDEDKGYVKCFFSPKGDKVELYSDYYLQKGDKAKNVCMLFFNDKDEPSSYTMFKLDKNGNYILDDEGIPIEDPKKKTFRKRSY